MEVLKGSGRVGAKGRRGGMKVGGDGEVIWKCLRRCRSVCMCVLCWRLAEWVGWKWCSVGIGVVEMVWIVVWCVDWGCGSIVN